MKSFGKWLLSLVPLAIGWFIAVEVFPDMEWWRMFTGVMVVVVANNISHWIDR